MEGDAIDPYQVLGVAQDASAEQIRAAYRRLARQHHPDLAADEDAARFRAVNEAYRSLAGSREAPGGATGPSPPTTPGRPATAPEPEPAAPSEPADSPPPGVSPLAAASILVPLAVICAPGPLLLCGVLLAPVGAVLGHLAQRQARRQGQPGSGLATVGIIVGWAVTTVVLVAVAIGVLINRGG